MTAAILFLNLCATAALWWELRRALDMTWQTSAAYAVGLVAWWVSAVLPAYDIGFTYGVYGIGR